MKHLSNFLRFGVVLLTSLTMLSGCGGGGGGGSSPPPVGALSVTVIDEYGVKVAGATVAIVGTTESRTTNDQGVAALPLAAGSATVTVSRATFLPQTISVPIINGELTERTVTLVRATSAAGGSLTSRGDPPSVVLPGSQTMTFQIDLVIVDGDSEPITGLSSANFALNGCTPIPGNSRADCVRGAAADFDMGYTPTTVPPQVLTEEPGEPAVPYAAALMLDQSGSIATSDPTGARLYSAKEFLVGLGASDRVLLSAFTDSAAVIPDTPLTVYPPFRDSTTVSDSVSYFDTLDSLATLVGGGTPLYDALDELVGQVATDLSVSGMAKSVIIFTDGDDTTCGGTLACRTDRQASITAAKLADVRIFTIGLTNQVNFDALGELANGTGGVFLFAESPEQLIPLYGSVGRLLSLSLPTYRLTWTVQATAADAFLPGNVLLGRVTVTAGGSTFDVPFFVAIPSP